jgi:hypothetical protein
MIFLYTSCTNDKNGVPELETSSITNITNNSALSEDMLFIAEDLRYCKKVFAGTWKNFPTRQISELKTEPVMKTLKVQLPAFA